MKSSLRQSRRLTENERAIVEVLLEAPFPGRKKIREQLKDCFVKQIDEEGSLEFVVNTEVRAPGRTRIPVEAEMKDDDGVPVRLLLHVVDDLARELEVYKGDSSPLIAKLTPSRLRIVKPGEDISLGTAANRLEDR